MSSTGRFLKSIKDVKEIESVPLDERLVGKSTYEVLTHSAETFPERTALRFLLHAKPDERPVEFTYKEFWQKVNQTANLFTSLGIQSTDVVSFLLPNLPETHFVIWGAEAAGIVNPVNPLLEPDQIASILNAAGTKILVTLPYLPKVDLWEKVSSILDQVPTLETVLHVDLAKYLPSWQRLLVKASRRLGGPDHSRFSQKIMGFEENLSSQPKDRLVSDRTIDPDDIAALFHTGGTTGLPKLAMQSHLNEVANAAMMTECVEINEHSGVFCALPLFHVNAVMVTGLAPFGRGACVTLLTPQGFRGPHVVPNFWKLVEKYKATFFSAVPTAYAALLKVPTKGMDISSLSFGVCGGAPMPTELFRKFEKTMDIKILEGYGLTEGTALVSVNPSGGERRIGSIGLRSPYQEIKIVQLGTNGKIERDCKVDEIGTLIIRGPSVFKGYKREEDNEGIWVEDGWFNTGDLGRKDDEDYFWLTGRTKELIIRGGHNIDPAIIEESLTGHPDVELAAAVGQPDAYAGELPAAFVTLKEQAECSSAELKTWTQDHITERAAIPVYIEILDEMPLTAIGKTFKPALKNRAAQRVLTNALIGQEIDAQVVIHSDSTHGRIAEVAVTDQKKLEEAEKILGSFAIKSEVR